MLLKNKHKINHIKIIINICIIVIYSIIFINKVVLANEGVCIDNGCHEERVIKVLVLYDDELFFEKGWENNLNNRLAEINDFYYSNFKIKWKVIAIKQYAFNKNHYETSLRNCISRLCRHHIIHHCPPLWAGSPLRGD